MSKKRLAHVGHHLYQRHKWGKNSVPIWRCMRPGCEHYLHKEFIEGKFSSCNECGQTFVMTKDKMARVKPKCDDCQKTISKTGADFSSLDQLLKDL